MSSVVVVTPAAVIGVRLCDRTGFDTTVEPYTRIGSSFSSSSKASCMENFVCLAICSVAACTFITKLLIR